MTYNDPSNHVLSMSTADLEFNPFSSEHSIAISKASSSTNPLNFTSSRPNSSRHRTSSSSGSESFHRLRRGGHERAQTEIVGASSSYSHPLRGASAFATEFDDTVTRPHLTRILNDGMLFDNPSDTSTPEDEEPNPPEAEVLVHEVGIRSILSVF